MTFNLKTCLHEIERDLHHECASAEQYVKRTDMFASICREYSLNMAVKPVAVIDRVV